MPALDGVREVSEGPQTAHERSQRTLYGFKTAQEVPKTPQKDVVQIMSHRSAIENQHLLYVYNNLLKLLEKMQTKGLSLQNIPEVIQRRCIELKPSSADRFRIATPPAARVGGQASGK